MPTGEKVGSAWYELAADDTKLKGALHNAESQLKNTGAAGERAFGNPIQRSIGNVRDKLSGLSKETGGLGRSVLAGVGLGAGVAAFDSVGTAITQVVGFLGDSVRKAQEEEVSIGRLNAALKANVTGYNGSTEAIEKVIEARLKLGFSDDEQRNSLARLVAITHDSAKALAVERTAMDLARLKGIDLGTATLVLGKVYGGNVSILRRYGIAIKDGATSTEALAAVQKLAAGQAEAFSNTSAGAAQSLAVTFDQLQEKAGKLLLPILTKLALFARDTLLPALQQVGAVIGDVAAVIGPVLSPLFAHFGEVVEALAVIFGVKLVVGLGRGIASLFAVAPAATAAGAALDEEAAAAERAAVATKGVGFGTLAIAAAIVIPILGSIEDGLDHFVNTLGKSKSELTDYGKVLQAVGGNEMEAGLLSKALSDIAKEQGRSIGDVTAAFVAYVAAGSDASDALTQVTNNVNNAGIAARTTGFAYTSLAGGSDAAAAGARRLNTAYADLAANVRGPLDKALSDTGATLTETGAVWAAKLKSGETVYATSAEELAQKLPDAQKQALEDAKAIAKKTPFEIAKSFKEGESAVYQAALELADQQHAAQDLALELTQKKNELASSDLAKQLKDKNASTRAAAIQHVNQLKDEIFALQAEINPAAALASKVLADRLRSADPQTRRDAAALADTLRVAIAAKQPGINALADKYGLTLPEAIDRYKQNARNAAAAQANAALQGLIEKEREFVGHGFTAGGGFSRGIGAARPSAVAGGRALFNGAQAGASGSLFGSGEKVGYSWIGGLKYSITSSAAAVAAAAEFATISLHGKSPPKSGPLREIDRWGLSVGGAWTSSLVTALQGLNLRDALSGIAAALSAPLSAPSLAFVAPRSPVALQAAVAASGPGSSVTPAGAAEHTYITNTYQLHVSGKLVEQSVDPGALIRRLQGMAKLTAGR